MARSRSLKYGSHKAGEFGVNLEGEDGHRTRMVKAVYQMESLINMLVIQEKKPLRGRRECCLAVARG